MEKEEMEKLIRDSLEHGEDELSQEQKKKLIREALEHGEDESKYVLILREWRYYHSRAEIKKIMGDVEYVLLSENLKDGEKEWEYAILPKTRTAVLVHEEETEINGVERHATLYVFTQDGWKSLYLY